MKLPAGAAFAGLQFNNTNPYTAAVPLSSDFANERLLGNFLDLKYNSMQVALRGQHTHVTYDFNYTWAHEFDDTVSVFGAFVNPTNPQPDFSAGDTDIRNNFTADIFYHNSNIPHLPKLIGKGWDVGSIMSARTGFPVNITTNVANDFSTPQRPELLSGVQVSRVNLGGGGPNNQLNASIFKLPCGGIVDPTAGCAGDASTATTEGTSSLGNIPRNAGRGPRFAQVDVTFIKHTPITQRLNTEFRVDLFNIANHPNFANPSGNAFVANGCYHQAVSGACTATQTLSPYTVDPGFGRSVSTVGNLIGIGGARQIQLAAKLIF